MVGLRSPDTLPCHKDYPVGAAAARGVTGKSGSSSGHQHGWTIAWLPTATKWTSSATSTTSPAISCPSTIPSGIICTFETADVDVRLAEAGDGDPQEDLPGSGGRRRHLGRDHLADTSDLDGAHCASL